MNVGHLILRELRHRPWSALTSLVLLAGAVAAVVFVTLTARASADATRIIQRDLGLNLLILPEEVDLDRYWIDGWSTATMPGEYLERVIDQEVANRLIPRFQQRIPLADREAMLTGVAQEVFQAGDRKKPVFGQDIADGRVVVGGAIATSLGISRGDELDLLGESFVVDQVVPSTGTGDDVRVFLNLPTVQRLLELPGRISEIHAIECECDATVTDPVAWLRAELEPLLPGTQIVRREAQAEGVVASVP